ncbi:GNAT family N-acetyltransferase [Robbsia andropogonis]|uniref:GNAT family N-acetyltransferase n=1 Tax=Robbsia andropogonis TaxID=28092 RepID=UPI00209FD7BF|nr:GNAT family N-acetyltransferase [Robbsia andropogonis]MCP1120280.1 GNAT family N-acetyltransferase [Robbsia andropogonis]MCP1130150.1 GNAT family N-acetyltransferase [Robbsia andropogonis]
MKDDNATGCSYRPFTPGDVAAAHALSVAVHWPHRPEDWHFALEVGNGFVAVSDGAIVGTALCWKYGTGHASLGLVIVSPNHQGRGVGRTLMKRLLDEVGARVTFLHATPEGQPLYEKLGFSVCGQLDQHQGNVANILPVALPDDVCVRAATLEDEATVMRLASRASRCDRQPVMRALLQISDCAVLAQAGKIVGFSMFRRFGRGYMVGPIVAPRSTKDVLAKLLIAHWLNGRTDEYIRLDVPKGAVLNDWLIEQGLKRVDTVNKMVVNAPAEAYPDAADPDCQLYGLVTQAMF